MEFWNNSIRHTNIGNGPVGTPLPILVGFKYEMRANTHIVGYSADILFITDMGR